MPLWQATLRPFGSEAIPFASYYIPVTPAISCNYALFCATARLHPLYFQWVPHSFRCHGGGYPPVSRSGPLSETPGSMCRPAPEAFQGLARAARTAGTSAAAKSLESPYTPKYLFLSRTARGGSPSSIASPLFRRACTAVYVRTLRRTNQSDSACPGCSCPSAALSGFPATPGLAKTPSISHPAGSPAPAPKKQSSLARSASVPGLRKM